MIAASLTSSPFPNLRALSACHPRPTSHCPVLPMPPAAPVSSLCKIRPLPTRSESTLAQLLIPLRFNSFGHNAYKKSGEGPIAASPKFVNSLPHLALVTPSYECHSERSEE